MNRRKYVKAMMKAIEEARKDVFDKDYKSSKTDALRVIKRFEKVNSCNFDPFNERHVDTISYHGIDESFFRSCKLHFNNRLTTSK